MPFSSFETLSYVASLGCVHSFFILYIYSFWLPLLVCFDMIFSMVLTRVDTTYQACSQVGAAGSDPVLDRISRFQNACWRFLRPHTIRGTALGSTLVYGCILIYWKGLYSIYSLVSFLIECWLFFNGSALVARALIENTHLIKWSLVLKALSGLLALICGNGYIVGINQIYDIGIDKYVAPFDIH